MCPLSVSRMIIILSRWLFKVLLPSPIAMIVHCKFFCLLHQSRSSKKRRFNSKKKTPNIRGYSYNFLKLKSGTYLIPITQHGCIWMESSPAITIKNKKKHHPLNEISRLHIKHLGSLVSRDCEHLLVIRTEAHLDKTDKHGQDYNHWELITTASSECLFQYLLIICRFHLFCVHAVQSCFPCHTLLKVSHWPYQA